MKQIEFDEKMHNLSQWDYEEKAKLRNEELEAMKKKVDDINHAHRVYNERLTSISKRRWLHKLQLEMRRNELKREFYEESQTGNKDTEMALGSPESDGLW